MIMKKEYAKDGNNLCFINYDLKDKNFDAYKAFTSAEGFRRIVKIFHR